MKIDSHDESADEFAKKTREGSSKKLTLSSLLKVLFPALSRVLRITSTSRDEFHYFKTVCQDLMKRREADKEHYEDFLELMINARATDSMSLHTNGTKDCRTQKVDDKGQRSRSKSSTRDRQRLWRHELQERESWDSLQEKSNAVKPRKLFRSRSQNHQQATRPSKSLRLIIAVLIFI
ncbi:hypothetical protein V5799_016089 [Amblyomma americanum]|uniref:Uncharacterized protein n=1 Tax=Amblyomma americanum TaxID=6943 RepID=A0AAQ4F6T6_AMBAM